jgi:apolipoprotein N-acyltransferase
LRRAGALRADPRARLAGALLAGALLPLAFAPFGFWPLAVLAPAVLFWLWEGAAPRDALKLGFAFGVGQFSVGTYWLYTSIHTFGQAPIWVAFALMLGLIAIMSLYVALLGFVTARVWPQPGLWRWLGALPAAWALVEWLRGWLFSGFAWLSLGYSQTDTALRALAPVGGTYLLTWVLALGAGACLALLQDSRSARIAAAAALALPWGLALALRPVEWTTASGAAVPVAVIQGAIPQDQKWLDSNRATTLALYRRLTEQALGTPLIVWPEAAAPDLANNLVPYLSELANAAERRGSALVMGLVRADQSEARAGTQYYNSVLALGDDLQWYDKHHLVPFAEFFPVPSFVRSWLRMMSLPYSDFTRGARMQPPLEVGGLALAASICYEDAYGSSLLPALASATALVNVTNDAWFGRSTARYQHLQISRMRAVEAQRFMIRAANDGVSAVIAPDGRVVARAAEFQPQVLRARVVPRLGRPPYARVGNVAIVLWLIGVLAAATIGLRRPT